MTVFSIAEFVFVGNTVSYCSKRSRFRQEIGHFLQFWIHKWTLSEEKTGVNLRENDQKLWIKPVSTLSISSQDPWARLEKVVENWCYLGPFPRVFTGLKGPKRVQFGHFAHLYQPNNGWVDLRRPVPVTLVESDLYRTKVAVQDSLCT